MTSYMKGPIAPSHLIVNDAERSMSKPLLRGILMSLSQKIICGGGGRSPVPAILLIILLTLVYKMERMLILCKEVDLTGYLDLTKVQLIIVP